MLLEGKVALITGGSKGLGRAICLAYAREGASVVTFSRDAVALKEVDEELSQIGRPHLVRPGDITKSEDIKKVVGESISTYGRIDILVNNASLLGPRVEIVNYPEEDWRAVLNTNLYGAFLLSKEVAQPMIAQRSGSIINVSSSVGRRGRARWGAYAVSKFGIEGMTQVLADELNPYNIRANSVNPGAMATVMRRAAYPDEDQTKLKKPEELVGVFLYLASDESIGKTGGQYDAQSFRKPV